MSTATRPARAPLTPEQELELLVAAQEADDTHRIQTPNSSWQVSLDAPDPNGEGSIGAELVGRDPWGLVDDCIDLGLDPSEVAYSGELVDTVPSGRGLLGGGLIDATQIPHGTAGGYQNHKCRCIPCTNAWATYKRERRAAKKAALVA